MDELYQEGARVSGGTLTKVVRPQHRCRPPAITEACEDYRLEPGSEWECDCGMKHRLTFTPINGLYWNPIGNPRDAIGPLGVPYKDMGTDRDPHYVAGLQFFIPPGESRENRAAVLKKIFFG